MNSRRLIARLEDLFNVVLIVIAVGLIGIDIVGAFIPTEAYLAVMTAALAALLARAVRPAQAPPPALDDILQDRSGYQGSIREFIGDGREFWVYAPSAVNTMANIAFIRETLLRNRRADVRFLIQDPQKIGAVDLLTQQLNDALTNFQDDCARSIKIMRDCRGDGLQYRLAPFSPGFGLTIVDAHSNGGKLSVEFLGYKNESIERRMHIVIHRADSPKWFDYYVDQFEKMWADSREDVG